MIAPHAIATGIAASEPIHGPTPKWTYSAAVV